MAVYRFVSGAVIGRFAGSVDVGGFQWRMFLLWRIDMFKFRRKQRLNSNAAHSLSRAVSVVLEPLEDRRLLSADFGWGGHGGFGGGFGGRADSTIAFSLAPTAVQTGLNTLATADGLTDPTATTNVHLGNSNGVETYSVTIDGTGTVSTLTVDQLGDAVTAPTYTTTTWATLSGTGTGSDSAAATEISVIATALSLTAPASTDTVNVTTTSAGAVTYSIQLLSSTTATPDWVTRWGGPGYGTAVTVDAAGDPVGNQQLPFSVFSTTIQNGLNKGAPTGATALAGTSTQNVDVQTTDGVTTYSTTYTASGTQTTVTVNAAGTLTNLPTTTTTTFSALSSSLQTELQTLATADGVTTTIAQTQSVTQLTETNGTIIYSVTLGATGTGRDGSTYTFDVTIAVDSNGNPTTLPNNGFGFGDQGFGAPGSGDQGFFGNGGDCGSDNSGSNSSSGSTSNSSSGSSSSNSSSTAISLPSGGSASATSLLGAVSPGTYSLSAKLLSSAINGFGGNLAGYLIQFAESKVDSAIITDVTDIIAAQAKLAKDTKSLTKAQKTTLSTDEKAISSAIKAISATVTPLEKTLKTDAAKYGATLKADLKIISKDKNNATALAAAKTQFATDAAAAFAGIAGDGQAIQTAINTASGVEAAQAKLASDLPTIAADQSAITADQSQLVIDIEASLSST